MRQVNTFAEAVEELARVEEQRADTARKLDALQKALAGKVAAYVGTIDGLEKKAARADADRLRAEAEVDNMRGQWCDLQNRCDVACEERDCLRVELAKARALALGSLAAAEARIGAA